MTIKDECSVIMSDGKIQLKENKSLITFINKSRHKVTKIFVDKCVFKDSDVVRCDYLLIDKNTEYFIELKGKDIQHAIEQLKNTIKQLSEQNNIKRSFIICSKFPTTTKKQIDKKNMKAIFEKNTKSKLFIKNSPVNFDIDACKFI